jgi:hypothetical protein
VCVRERRRRSRRRERGVTSDEGSSWEWTLGIVAQRRARARATRRKERLFQRGKAGHHCQSEEVPGICGLDSEGHASGGGSTRMASMEIGAEPTRQASHIVAPASRIIACSSSSPPEKSSESAPQCAGSLKAGQFGPLPRGDIFPGRAFVLTFLPLLYGFCGQKEQDLWICLPRRRKPTTGHFFAEFFLNSPSALHILNPLSARSVTGRGGTPGIPALAVNPLLFDLIANASLNSLLLS